MVIIIQRRKEKEENLADQNSNRDHIITPSEMGEALRDLNQDIYDDLDNLKLDMRSYLSDAQIPYLICLDTLFKMGIVTKPHEHLTSRVKRLYCSNEGKASRDIVSIATGKVDEKKEKGIIKKLFGKKDKGEKENVEKEK